MHNLCGNSGCRFSSGGGRNAIQQTAPIFSRISLSGAKSCQFGMERVSGVCRFCLCSLWHRELLPLRRDLTSDVALLPWEVSEINQKQVRRSSACVCVCALFHLYNVYYIYIYFTPGSLMQELTVSLYVLITMAPVLEPGCCIYSLSSAAKRQ